MVVLVAELIKIRVLLWLSLSTQDYRITMSSGGELLPDDLIEIINKCDFLSVKEHEGGHKRIHCKYTNHEIVPRKSDVERYLQSAKLRKAKEWYSHDYSQYYPEHIVKHKDNPKLLYCRLTKSVLMMKPSVVKTHISGKKFNTCLKAYEEREQRNEENDVLDGDWDEDSVGGIEKKEEELGKIGLTMNEMEHEDDHQSAESESENEERGGENRKNRIEVAMSGVEEPRGGVRNKKRKLEKQHKLGKKKKRKASSHLDASENNGDDSNSTTAAAETNINTKTKNNFSNDNTPVIDDTTWEAYKAKHTKRKIKKAKAERMRAKEIRMARKKVEESKETELDRNNAR